MDVSVHNVDGRPAHRTGTQAVERALRLLPLLADKPLTTTELSRSLECPRTTTLRLLQALERHAYVVRDDGRWMLGVAVLSLASRQNSYLGLATLLSPYLQDLVERFEETAVFCVRDGLDSLCVAKLESPQSMRVTTSVGSRMPLHAGATGRTLLAFAPDSLREAVLSRPLMRLAANTHTDLRAVRESLEDIRQSGYGYSESEIDDGAFAMATPIWMAADEPIGALAVAGPTSRLSEEIRESLASYLLELSDMVSRETEGWHDRREEL